MVLRVVTQTCMGMHVRRLQAVFSSLISAVIRLSRMAEGEFLGRGPSQGMRSVGFNCHG